MVGVVKFAMYLILWHILNNIKYLRLLFKYRNKRYTKVIKYYRSPRRLGESCSVFTILTIIWVLIVFRV